MNLKCFAKGHDYEKVEERWVNNMQDEYIATNYGGSIKSYQCDINKCKRCLKEKFVYNGKERII